MVARGVDCARRRVCFLGDLLANVVGVPLVLPDWYVIWLKWRIEAEILWVRFLNWIHRGFGVEPD